METIEGWVLPVGIGMAPRGITFQRDTFSDEVVELVGSAEVQFLQVGIHCQDATPDMMPFVCTGVANWHAKNDPDLSDVNWLAMSLFAKDEPVYGDVVIVSATDPATGREDGDQQFHSLPPWFQMNYHGVVAEAAHENVLEMAKVSQAILRLTADGIVSEEEFFHALQESSDEEWMDLAELAVNYVHSGIQLPDDIDEALKGLLDEQ